jgi:hypothetical protein
LKNKAPFNLIPLRISETASMASSGLLAKFLRRQAYQFARPGVLSKNSGRQDMVNSTSAEHNCRRGANTTQISRTTDGEANR